MLSLLAYALPTPCLRSASAFSLCLCFFPPTSAFVSASALPLVISPGTASHRCVPLCRCVPDSGFADADSATRRLPRHLRTRRRSIASQRRQGLRATLRHAGLRTHTAAPGAAPCARLRSPRWRANGALCARARGGRGGAWAGGARKTTTFAGGEARCAGPALGYCEATLLANLPCSGPGMRAAGGPRRAAGARQRVVCPARRHILPGLGPCRW